MTMTGERGMRMQANRRDFLKGTMWMGAVAALSGCVTKLASQPGRMSGFAAKPVGKLRVGFVGLGMRGPAAVHRYAAIPGAEVAALCDLFPERVEAQQEWLRKNGHPAARAYSGEEGWKRLCESELDLVYVATPWALHAAMGLYAMEHGKHVAIEVPAAMTLEECWALVETSERTGRHCMQLENCGYGEAEMLCLNLVRNGYFGEIYYGEGGYVHDLRELNFLDPKAGGYQGYWRLKWNESHLGNPYPTHGLVPVMQAMNINRGDRMEYLTCVQTDPRSLDEYAAAKFGPESWQAKVNPRCGDHSTTMIRTVKGKMIVVQHNVVNARPYSRINKVCGMRGMFEGINFPEKPEDYVWAGDAVHFSHEEAVGAGAHCYDNFERLQKVREEYRHPLWRAAGELAQKIGGHGGMDFLMDLRLAYCLQNGEPLDMDVYDLASSCSLCELSERSVRLRGQSVEVPDFTRGGWKTAKPLGIVSVDVEKLGIKDVQRDEAQLNV